MVLDAITGHPSFSDDSGMSATDVGERERLFAAGIDDLGSGRRVDFNEQEQTFFDQTVAAGGTGEPSEQELVFAHDIYDDAEVPEDRGFWSRFATGDVNVPSAGDVFPWWIGPLLAFGIIAVLLGQIGKLFDFRLR